MKEYTNKLGAKIITMSFSKTLKRKVVHETVISWGIILKKAIYRNKSLNLGCRFPYKQNH